jgi:hypothetical protein
MCYLHWEFSLSIQMSNCVQVILKKIFKKYFYSY